MHHHTKQWLDKFDDRYVRKTPYIELWRETKTQDEQIKEMKLFLVEALKSQAEMIRDEMVESIKVLSYEHNEARHGSTVDDVYSRIEEQGLKSLDSLINSFK